MFCGVANGGKFADGQEVGSRVSPTPDGMMRQPMIPTCDAVIPSLAGAGFPT